MSILLTGGTGHTSSRVAPLLQSANKKVILASRHPSSDPPTPTIQSVKFDWRDPSTYENPFKTNFGDDIESAYLVSPGGSTEVLAAMKPFIDLAIDKGVKRFVFISAGIIDVGGPSVGKVHEYLVNSGVDYCVVRPSWFFENALSVHLKSINVDNEIITASEDGKIGFVAADDIADLVAEALLVEKSYNTDFIITGPELLSYDEVAETFSSVLGRTIRHTRYTPEELKKWYIAFGISEEYATIMAYTESLNAAGEEAKLFAVPAPKKRTGKRTLKDFKEQNKQVWLV